jgi:hypothetical protein
LKIKKPADEKSVATEILIADIFYNQLEGKILGKD